MALDRPEHVPAVLDRHVVELLDGFGAIVWAVLAHDGTVIRANRGFREAIGEHGGGAVTAHVEQVLVHPSWSSVSATAVDPDGTAFRGLITLEDATGEAFSVAGAIAPLDEGRWLLFAEHDVGEVRRLAAQVMVLNEELSRMQRELVRARAELERSNAELAEQAIRDSLTGLHNRRYALDWFEKEIARSRRDGRPLSAVMADIDDFKDVNDRHGHGVGDRVLTAVAAAMCQDTRTYDLAARLGGDELIVGLAETTAEDATEFAQRLRVRVAALQIDGLPEGVRASLGVATAGDESVTAFLDRIDGALYASKRAGRDRVTVWTPDDADP